MVKLATQDVPALLADLYADYVSPTAIGQPDTAPSRTRRAANIAPRKSRKDKAAYRAIAVKLFDDLKWLGSPLAVPNFVKEETARLVRGEFTADYWQQCTRLSAQNYQATPSNAADTSPDSYAYRDPAQNKTTPTYPAGAPVGTQPATAGAVSGGEWRDTSWTWRRSVFEVEPSTGSAHPPSLIWITSGSIEAAATLRGSRPMLSIIMKAFICEAGDAPTTTAAPPIAPHTSIYSRYVQPDTAPPYYAATIPVSAQKPISDRAITLAGNTADRAVILSAPRPMFGHGWNNNSTVSTEWTDSEQLWQTKPVDKKPPVPGRQIIKTFRPAIAGANDPVYTFATPKGHLPLAQLQQIFTSLAAGLPRAERWQRDSNPAQKATVAEGVTPPDGWTNMGSAPNYHTLSITATDYDQRTGPDITGWPMGWGPGNLPIAVVQLDIS